MHREKPSAIHVSIIRWCDDAQPGWVECSVEDAHGRQWTFVEKAPVVSDEDLDAVTSYPRPGSIACQVIERRVDAEGRVFVVVDTAAPWGIAATSGETRFEFLEEQVVEMRFGGQN